MSEFVAALPMYDWPERRTMVDAEWSAIRDRLRAAGVAAPEHLTRRNADLPAVPGCIRDRAGKIIASDPATLPPDELDLPTLWRHPKLLFAQTCWGPMETTGLAAHVRVVAQPDYSGVEGGAGEFYTSAVVMRLAGTPPSGLPAISPSRGEIGSFNVSARSGALEIGEAGGDGVISPLEGEMAGRPEGGVQAPPDGRAVLPLGLLRGARLAFNEPHSMSGFLALSRDLDVLGESVAIFPERIETGGHRASIRAVAEGKADVAAIDCLTWHLARQYEPAAKALRVVGWTARRKGLPFIAAASIPDDLFAAIRAAIAS